MEVVANASDRDSYPYDKVIRPGLDELFVSEAGKPKPDRKTVVAALRSMSNIAQNNIPGEPVVEWRDDANELVVADPFLKFYLAWGVK